MPPSDARSAPLGRGLRMRCPRCGGGGIFASFFELHDDCPTCDYAFVREDGYWVGAMTVVFAVIEGLFGLVFVGGMVVTWPDVPWNAFLVVGLVLNSVVAVALYPWSKTVWMGLHATFSPRILHEAPEPEVLRARAAREREAARANAAREAGAGRPGPDGDG